MPKPKPTKRRVKKVGKAVSAAKRVGKAVQGRTATRKGMRKSYKAEQRKRAAAIKKAGRGTKERKLRRQMGSVMHERLREDKKY